MRSCTSYCHQGRKPCPCPQACEVPEAGATRTALAITAWFASAAICIALALVWIYGA